jgi:dUTP pyrophosphatase
VDADYFGNHDNEGEVFFQFINLGPNPVLIKKGDKIGQGIFEKYLVTETDEATEKRTGGFGSSGK